MTSIRMRVALAAASVIALSVNIAADEGSSAARAALGPDARVRGFDRSARQVIATAVACSPTVARMVADLQASDLIVGVETRPLHDTMLGELRIVAASAGVRHVRIHLRIPSTMQDLIAVLSHELQHAVEMAAAPEVRDTTSQRSFYLRVGYEGLGRGRFETDAALKAGRLVAKEIAGCGVGRR